MSRMRILIVGAGIGGLTAAACLLRRGHDVTVFEQAPQLGEVGAGIQISANANRVFAEIGVADRVAHAGALPKEYRFRTFDTGEVLQTIRFGDHYGERWGASYVSIHRADLHAILVGTVRDLRADAIQLNRRATGYEEDAGGVTLRFADGGTERGDLAVGADGIKSTIRSQILGHAEADYTGDSVWRAIVPAEWLAPEHRTDCVEIFVGPGKHCVVYPLRQGSLINLAGCVEQASWDEESWTSKRPWEEMRADFLNWNPMVNAIIEAAPRDECYRWVLKNRKPVDNWSTSRATLLGDAAHPTLPYMAQGSAMAVEDAAVLARALDQAPTVADALLLYQRNRLGRTARVLNESTANRALFHMEDMAALRHAFAGRDFSGERNEWLFSYDAARVELV